VEHESEGGLSPAEQLPAIYRAVLDSVAELERRGERLEASRFRSEAIRAYSRAWDIRGRHRLESILRRAQRALAEAPESVPEPVTAAVTEAAQPTTDAVQQRVPTTI
jgi:hypothetical protein